MPWFAKYDGVDGSSRSDAHLLYDLVVPTGQNPDQAVTFTAIAMAESDGQRSSVQIIGQGGAEGSSRLFVGNLTYNSHADFQPELTSDPTVRGPSLDGSAVATLHSFDFLM